MADFFKYHKFSILLVLAGILFYWSFGYDLDRSNFLKLISLYVGLFFISFKLIQLEKDNFWLLAGTAMLFRFLFIPTLPNLSQDFYRFIWDGQLILEGINPYLSVPNVFSTSLEPLRENLILGMGSLSAGNFTSYPPVNQLFFAVSVFLGGKSILGAVIWMRVFIIAADFGILYFGRKLLQKINLPAHRIFWFVLNPFIIIELTGNLHFEGIMISFLLCSLYLLFEKKWVWSAILFGISVSVKLLPLLFLPLFWHYFLSRKKGANSAKTVDRLDERAKAENISAENKLGFKTLLRYYLLVGVTVLVSFLPFISSTLITNFSNSISLWFQKFEFNASIYYIIRWIGFQFTGYNIIGTFGKISPVIVLILVGYLAFFRRNYSFKSLINVMLLAVTFYFLMATTVHPWYLVTPLLLSLFTPYRFALLWSFLVFFSYEAYGNKDFSENYWLIAIEYLIVFGYFLYELFQKKTKL
ncbi:hypothetical protein SAMN05444483_1287 [Salegentibacter echinorum]|uniref:Mannosyltransferase n=1 Tax=Salegentibacter echinorum TaxID=1073325 RepID=A0A1M5MEY0_SALEC|nr:mannosyltransferase [Salegentibacter echinorum]SHG75974.1 hypothetical protein SAMN05444483_1287 [Salegentibacter echinorum]